MPEDPGEKDAVTEQLQPDGESANESASQSTASTSRRRWHLPHMRPEILLPARLRRRLGSAARVVSLGLIVVIIAGAGFGAWTTAKHFGLIGAQPVVHFRAVVTPFRVDSTEPANQANDVLDGTQITINFTRAVTPDDLTGDFFVSPQVGGTFKRGDSAEQVIFTPTTPFAAGTIVKVMIHGEFQSNDGTKLGADYSFGFTMATGKNSVTFQRDGFQYDVDSAPAGQSMTYTMQVGDAVNAKQGTITVYKTTTAELLKSLVYTQTPSSEGNWVDTSFADLTVNTDTMQAVQTITGLKDGKTFTISQAEGVYAVVAQDGNEQAGHFWLVASDFGVVMRQDDQQMVLYAHDYSDNVAPTITATTYSLKDSVQQLAQATIAGSGSINTGFSPTVDVVVAQTADGHSVFIPVAGYLSMADVRVQKDLSTNDAFYGVTDRPTYAVGETLHYAAYVRADDDALYQLPDAGSTVRLYVAESPWDKHLADFTASVSANGVMSGDVKIPASYATKNGIHKLTLYAVGGPSYAPNQIVDNDQPVASFVVTEHANTTGRVVVSFGKSSYLASDTVAASVQVTNASGAPLANTAVQADVYAKQYYETDDQANQQNLDGLGQRVDALSGTFHTDANGRVSVPIDTHAISGNYSQTVTVQASFKSNGVTAAGGASAVIHQGNGVLIFGSSPSAVTPGGTLIGRVYAKNLLGAALSNATMNYKLISRIYDTLSGDDVTTTLGSGQVKADSSGFAQISLKLPSKLSTDANLELDVSTGDSLNNQITSLNYYYVGDTSGSTASSDVQLTSLDISGAPSEVAVGQTLNLTVHAPAAIDALVTLERGRIYKTDIVHLNQGNNSYTVNVTSALLPSFNLVFSYISDGSYTTQGVSFTVTPTSKLAALALTTDESSYTAGSTATITLKAHDAASSPLATPVILGVVDSHVYDLYRTVTPDILTYLYSPRETTTNGSSSLTIVGSGGGKCGGGGPDQSALSNPTGATLLWSPAAATDSTGTYTTSLKLPKGTWHVYAYTMNESGVVGSAALTVTAK